MKNFFKKQREAMAFLAYVIIIAGLVYLVILPLIAKINNANDQIQQESMKQESVKLHIEQLPKIQKQYQIVQDKGDLGNALLNKNKAVILIERLEKMAEITNNKITINVQSDPVSAVGKKTVTKTDDLTADTLITELPNQDYLQMKISLIGDYNSILAFVGLLEKFEYYADIVEIKINKNQPMESSTQASVSPGLFGVNNGNSNISAPSVVKDVNAVDSNALNASLTTVFYTN